MHFPQERFEAEQKVWLTAVMLFHLAHDLDVTDFKKRLRVSIQPCVNFKKPI